MPLSILYSFFPLQVYIYGRTSLWNVTLSTASMYRLPPICCLVQPHSPAADVESIGDWGASSTAPLLYHEIRKLPRRSHRLHCNCFHLILNMGHYSTPLAIFLLLAFPHTVLLEYRGRKNVVTHDDERERETFTRASWTMWQVPFVVSYTYIKRHS